MPDWTYRTVFRPLLFRLPAETARDSALGFMGRLGRMPLGRSVIELMGHMRPDPRLRVEDPRGGAGLPTPVGLGCGLDLRSNAAAAFSQFGFGLLELGPVSKQGRHAELRRLDSPEGLSKVGMTDVFVPEDLEFMGTTAECLRGSHPSLVPLVAHDRATFGGMLLSCGVAVLLPALWGFRRGQAWLWWSLLLAGSVAYLSTIAVHWAVGYLSLKHLLPAYLGLLLLWLASLLSWPHLAASDPQLEQRWRRWLTPRR